MIIEKLLRYRFRSGGNILSKKEIVLLLFGPLLMLLIGILIVSYYPSLNEFKPLNIDTIQKKIEYYKKYQMSKYDYEYLHELTEVLQSSNDIITSIFSIFKYLSVFILVISIFQITYITRLYSKIRKKGMESM